MKGVTDKTGDRTKRRQEVIGSILGRASIKTIYKLNNELSQFFTSVKYEMQCVDVSLYKLDCDCGKSYIDQIKNSLGVIVK